MTKSSSYLGFIRLHVGIATLVNLCKAFLLSLPDCNLSEITRRAKNARINYITRHTLCWFGLHGDLTQQTRSSLFTERIIRPTNTVDLKYVIGSMNLTNDC